MGRPRKKAEPLIKKDLEIDLNRDMVLYDLNAPTKEIADTIAEYITMGMSIDGAVRLAGVLNKQLFDDWYAKGVEFGNEIQSGMETEIKEQHIPYIYLAYAINKAEGLLELEMVTCFKSFRQTSWQAVDSFLKKRLRDQWGDRDTQKMFATNTPVKELETDSKPTFILMTPDNGRLITDDTAN